MADDDKVFDNSQEAVWQREINELSEQLKHPERYSSSEFVFKQSRKKELEEALAKRKQKKDLTGAFAKGKQNIQNMETMQMLQMAGDRAA